MIYKVYQHPFKICALHNITHNHLENIVRLPYTLPLVVVIVHEALANLVFFLRVKVFFPFPSLTHSRNLWGPNNCRCCHHCGAEPWTSKEQREDRLWRGLWEYLQWAGLAIGVGYTTLLLMLILFSYYGYYWGVPWDRTKWFGNSLVPKYRT